VELRLVLLHSLTEYTLPVLDQKDKAVAQLCFDMLVAYAPDSCSEIEIPDNQTESNFGPNSSRG